MRGSAAVIAAMVTGAWIAAASAQQQPADNQPGRKWTEEQLREASSARPRRPHADAEKLAQRRARGRGADLHVNNTANQLRGRRHGGRRADRRRIRRARQGLPRVLDVLDQHERAGHVLRRRDGRASSIRRWFPRSSSGKRHEIGVLGWSDENPVALNDAAEEERLLDERAIDYLTKSGGPKTGRRARPVGPC